MFDVIVEDSLLNTLKQNPDKKYRIGDVSRFMDVKIYILRYWEDEFKNFIHPEKSSGGQNLYSHKDIETFAIIKKLLYSEGFNIAGAKKKLKELHARSTQEVAPMVSKELLVVIKEELQDIRKKLKKLRDGL